ncbi:MFS transporter [Promineifilum sp.]|uniref:MFS transporter n=1 Tax=Promineifilum sp. TaxID=2664178 RepID=UPI0035B14DB1
MMNSPTIRTFLIIWFGQFVSRVGTAMTRFALLIWAYQQTGAATTVALLGFFAFVPYILFSPIAGVWVDRLDRRLIMLFTDLGAGLITAALLVLYFTDTLAIWHLYAAEALTAALDAFQEPAYGAASTVLLPKEFYARGNGLRSMAQEGARVLAPFLAGLLIPWVGVSGVLFADVATFLVAVLTLLLVRVPAVRAEGEAERPDFWGEMRVGFDYLRQRPGLLGLTLHFTIINFFAALTYFAILPAMVLARTGGDEVALGLVQGALGAAGVIGGLLMAAWGGPRRKIHGVLIATALSFLLGDFLFAVGQGVLVWVIAACAAAVFIPIIVGSRQAIWQSKVAPALQGRVFSTDGMMRLALFPFGYLFGGILADRVLEPAMLPGGALAPLFGGLVGVGPGAGMGLMFVGTATLGTLFSLAFYLIPAVRNVETELTDFQ